MRHLHLLLTSFFLAIPCFAQFEQPILDGVLQSDLNANNHRLLNVDEVFFNAAGTISIFGGPAERLNLVAADGVILQGVRWPDTDGTNGQVLVTDGAGTTSWVSVAGDIHSDTVAPTANDDSANTSGNGVFSVGDIWVKTGFNDVAYICNDATPTAAVWRQATEDINRRSLQVQTVFGTQQILANCYYDGSDFRVGDYPGAQSFRIVFSDTGAGVTFQRAVPTGGPGSVINSWINVAEIQRLTVTTADPTTSDNFTQMYYNGALWVNSATDGVFVLVDQLAGTWSKLASADQLFTPYSNTVDPTANDDSANTSGNGVFSDGDIWVNTSSDSIFICASATTGSAVWVNVASALETDPVFSAAPAAGILAGDITNWNTAFGWGDHASAGYLTSFTETDPTLTSDTVTIGAGNLSTSLVFSTSTSNGTVTHSHSNGFVFDKRIRTPSLLVQGQINSTGLIFTVGPSAGFVSTRTNPGPGLIFDTPGQTIAVRDPTDTAYGFLDFPTMSVDQYYTFPSSGGTLVTSADLSTLETDPVFSAAPAAGILAGDITNWNTAFGWGNHASVGYLTSFTETDPVFGASPAAGILAGDITNWNTAFGWGNHASAGYLPTSGGLMTGNLRLDDGVLLKHEYSDRAIRLYAGTITDALGQVSIDWGNREVRNSLNNILLSWSGSMPVAAGLQINGAASPLVFEGTLNAFATDITAIDATQNNSIVFPDTSGTIVLTSTLSALETDPIFGASPAAGILAGDISNWNTAFGWGDHSIAGYLTTFTETDPVFSAAPAAGILAGDIINWNTAFGWGDHGAAGYLTSFTETDPVFGASPAAGILAGDISNWNTAFGWGDHGMAGYVVDGLTEDQPFNSSAAVATHASNPVYRAVLTFNSNVAGSTVTLPFDQVALSRIVVNNTDVDPVDITITRTLDATTIVTTTTVGATSAVDLVGTASLLTNGQLNVTVSGTTPTVTLTLIYDVFE